MRFLQNKFLGIVLGVLILAGLVLLVYSSSEKNGKTETVTESQSNISDWQTYTNTEHGFEIKYPSNWVLNLDVAGEVIHTNPILDLWDQEKFKLSKDCEEVCRPNISINLTKIENLDKYISRNSTHLYRLQKMNFHGYNAYEFITDDGVNENFYLLVDKDGEIYEVTIYYESSKQDLTETENQILSTFKFSTVIPADWKTYTSLDYKFEIKYPPSWTVKQDQQTRFIIQESSNCYATLVFKTFSNPEKNPYNLSREESEKESCQKTLNTILSTYKFVDLSPLTNNPY